MKEEGKMKTGQKRGREREIKAVGDIKRSMKQGVVQDIFYP
jgi:hypothetical protein